MFRSWQKKKCEKARKTNKNEKKGMKFDPLWYKSGELHVMGFNNGQAFFVVHISTTSVSNMMCASCTSFLFK